MSNNLNKAKEILHAENLSCVLLKGEEIYRSELAGIKPLIIHLDSGKSFNGFSAADKIVGRAAAFLYINLGVCEVYADVMSKAAKELLEKNSISAEAECFTEKIINRKGDDICPMDKAIADIYNADEAYQILKGKINM